MSYGITDSCCCVGDEEEPQHLQPASVHDLVKKQSSRPKASNTFNYRRIAQYLIKVLIMIIHLYEGYFS